MAQSDLLLEILEQDYFPRKRDITSTSTRTHYRVAIKHLGLMLGRPPQLADLTDDTIERFITYCLNVRGLARYTVKQRRGYLVALWTWCAKRNLADTFPTVPPLAVPRHIPQAWSLDELQLLLAACKQTRGEFGGVPARDWWTSIHCFWFYEGERLSATLAARWCDYRDGVLTIHAGDRKGRMLPAAYNLHPTVHWWLEQIRLPAREKIWPWPFHRSRFYQLYRELIESSGLVWTKRTGPQKLRRTHASHVMASGGDPTASLFHSSHDVTRRFYLDPKVAKPIPQNRLLPRID